MFPSPDTSTRATPSLQWVPWPPLAGALRFPTFIGSMGFYDCSRSVRNPSGRPLESRTSPTEEETESSLRFLGHPCGACPGLGTPASRPDLANNGRCQILPSARLNTSASPRQTISGLNPHGLLPPCLRFAPTSRPVNGKTRYCLSARLWSGGIYTRWMTIRGFANSSSVPPLPSFPERDSLDFHDTNPPKN
jgi:hypothetical protein